MFSSVIKMLLMQSLSLVVSSYDGEDVLVSFGGYNGRYNNEVNILSALFPFLLCFSLCFIILTRQIFLLLSGLCS